MEPLQIEVLPENSKLDFKKEAIAAISNNSGIDAGLVEILIHIFNKEVENNNREYFLSDDFKIYCKILKLPYSSLKASIIENLDKGITPLSKVAKNPLKIARRFIITPGVMGDYITKAETHTRKQLAEHFGTSVNFVQHLIKRTGVVPKSDILKGGKHAS